jgi:hypothetical protein
VGPIRRLLPFRVGRGFHGRLTGRNCRDLVVSVKATFDDFRTATAPDRLAPGDLTNGLCRGSSGRIHEGARPAGWSLRGEFIASSRQVHLKFIRLWDLFAQRPGGQIWNSMLPGSQHRARQGPRPPALPLPPERSATCPDKPLNTLPLDALPLDSPPLDSLSLSLFRPPGRHVGSARFGGPGMAGKPGDCRVSWFCPWS